LAFGRRQPLAPKVVNAGRLLRGLDDMLRRSLGEGIEIETIVAGGLWNTFADVGQLENALLNLAINSRDAMAGHGKLTIEAGNASLDDQYVARHGDLAPGQYVMIAVTDTGCGMSPELVDRVFEPFFTTKPEGQGTGLGLSMVYGFVKQSGGHIKIYSEPGHGTTVRMYLPRSREQETAEAEIDRGPTVGGSETILVVEDDEDVRATVVEMLTDLGYRVLRAKDAQSAFAIIESGVPIDLLFTDIVMPGPMRSTELARKARERMPRMAVLFTSGYTENAVVHGGRLDEGVDLLSKPYTKESLARKLRQCLRNRQPQSSETRSYSDTRRNSSPSKPALAKADGDGATAKTPLRILFVEDDALIRISTTDMLSSLGHEIHPAEDASRALDILKKEAIDVLITDVGLPGVSGSELAAQACRLRPELKVVFASGYQMSPGAFHKDLAGKSTVVGKPYDDQALARALSSVLATSRTKDGSGASS
jgi:CheY-like chemotaxis protein